VTRSTKNTEVGSPIRLGINIDHVATLRNARGEFHPDPLRAAAIAIEAGADNITAHLREDRRHIRDGDMERLASSLTVPLNMEMAVTPEMLKIALRLRPHACCLVPERRQEITTEGGLDVKSQDTSLKRFVAELQSNGIQVSLFIDPDPSQIAAAQRVEAKAIELHTGAYCRAALKGDRDTTELELQRLIDCARLAAGEGQEVHAGHGLNYDNVSSVAAIPEIVELNIGHHLVGEAIFVGLYESVRRMRETIDAARIGFTSSRAARA
jgi:pyridoxine 5-phosphate synthase